MKSVILSVLIMRNALAIMSLVLVLLTTVLGILMTNSEIKTLGLLSITGFGIALCLQLIYQFLTRPKPLKGKHHGYSFTTYCKH